MAIAMNIPVMIIIIILMKQDTYNDISKGKSDIRYQNSAHPNNQSYRLWWDAALLMPNIA